MEYILSDAERQEIVEYALNPANWHHNRIKKPTTREDVNRMLDNMAKSLTRVRDDYLKQFREQQENYRGLMN